MQRLPVVCAVALIALAAPVVKNGIRVVTAAPRQAPGSTSGISSASKMEVVATGIAARSLAIGPPGSRPILYVTNANMPNQIFRIGGVASVPGGPMAAIAGTGRAGSLGDGGPATVAQFDLEEQSLAERSAIAVAADGTIYVADSGNSSVRAIAGPASTEPGVIRSAVGRWAATPTFALTEPMSIAVDRTGDLFIADHAGETVDRLSATGQIDVLAHVTSPATIAVTPDGSIVFLASPETGAVFSIATQPHAITIVAGFPGPATDTEMAQSVKMTWASSGACSAPIEGPSPQICPTGLAADATGNLFVSDLSTGRILRIDARTSAATTVATGLNQPGALAMDANGNLYAAEQGANRIVAFAQVGASQGSLSVTPSSATYGNEPSGGTTSTQSFTVSNISSTAIAGLNIPKTTAPADFTVQANSCTTTLPANSSCTLSVAFTPTTTGARSGTLTVTDSNAADSASTVLSGTGDDYQLQLASGQLMSVSVQAGNAATFNLQVLPDNVFSGGVALVCPGNLPTNTTCTFSSPTVNVTPGTPAAFSVTFQTTGIINPFGAAAFPASIFSNSLCVPLLSSMLAVLMFFCLATGGRQPAKITLGLLLVGLSLFGCSKGRSEASVGATPAGTSTMAVTGNAQNASRALTITLNVVQQ